MQTAAHPARRSAPARLAAALMAAVCGAGFPPSPATAPPEPKEDVAPPPPVNPPLVPPDLPPEPVPGKGRLSLVFGGNRQWCTFPDDRLIKPPEPLGPARKGRRNEVHTFGYKFIVSAVRRGAPQVPLMLYESPLVQTAAWRPAAKLGRSGPTGVSGPRILSGEGAVPPAPPGPGPSTLVPFWKEQFRCTTVAERFDFDLEPGTYDVYIAFDLLLRQGNWVHRTADYLTDVPIEAARSTRLEGLVNLGGGNQREVALLRSTLLPPAEPPGAGGP